MWMIEKRSDCLIPMWICNLTTLLLGIHVYAHAHWEIFQKLAHTHIHVTQTSSCIKHSMLTLPSISAVYGTHSFIHTIIGSLCWDQRYVVFRCALPFSMTLSCQCYLLQTYTQAHTEHLHKLTLPQTRSHIFILTNLTEPFMLAGYQMFPPLLTI